MARATESAGVRELFIDELAAVQGGGAGCPGCYTTEACCEEGPFDGCCTWLPIEITD